MVANLQRFRSWFIFLSLTLTVAACGGGGGGSKPTPTPDDETPASFAFTSATDAALGASLESNTVTIDDINLAVAVTIADGEYSINDGAFTAADGTLNEGDTLTLRGVASSEFSSDVVVGVTVGTVTETFTISTLAQDTTPEAFAFSAQTEVPLDALLESEEAITVSGTNDDASISISGGEYAIGEGDFTADDGTVASGQSVKVRLTSSSSFSTATTATLNIGDVTGDFTVTTLAADTTPETFAFNSVSDMALSATAESNAVTISGINTSTPVSVQNGEYKIGDGAYTSEAGTIENGQAVRVRATASGTFSTAVVATLNVGGVEGTFTATTVAQDITPDDFSFTSATQAPLNSTISSPTATIIGITGAVPIGVQNGWYRIDSGAATMDVGTITNSQTVTVSGASSSEFETETVVTLTVGNVIRTFNFTTETRDIVPDDFSFSAVTGADLDTQYESAVKTISGINDVATISVTNGEYRIDGAAYTSINGTIEDGQEVQVRTTSSSAADTEVEVMLTVGGLARVYSVTTLADEEAPTASIVFPPPTSLTEGTTITVRGKATDNLSSVTSVTVKGGAADAVATSSDDFATWEAVVTLTADSVNALSVSATDGADNTGDDLAEVSVKQDATLADFPDSNVPLELPVAMALDKANNRLFIADAYANDEINDKILSIDIATGVRTLLGDNTDGDLAFPMKRLESMVYDENTLELFAIETIGRVMFEFDISTGERIPFPLSPFNSNGDNPCTSTVTSLIIDPRDGESFLSGCGNRLDLIDRDTEERTILSSNTIPDTVNQFGDVNDVIFDPKNERIITVSSAFDSIFAVSLEDGARTYITRNFTDSDFYPNYDLPLIRDSRSMAMDVDQNRVLVADYGAIAILAVDLDTGIRSTLSDNSTPGSTNGFSVPEEILYDDDFGYAFVVDSGNDALMAVDIVNGERVFISKATVPD